MGFNPTLRSLLQIALQPYECATFSLVLQLYTSTHAHELKVLRNFASMDIKSLVKLAKSLSDPTRLRLLQEIAKGDITVCADLFQYVPISQPSMSQHLKALSEAGLIESHKEGRNMCMSIKAEKLQELEDFLQLLKPATVPR